MTTTLKKTMEFNALVDPSQLYSTDFAYSIDDETLKSTIKNTLTQIPVRLEPYLLLKN